MKQLSLRVCLHLDPQDTAGTPEEPKRQYKAKGTVGTFGGQRPPKASRLLAEFEKRRRAYQAELHKKNDTKSESYAENRAYHKFMKKMIPMETEGSARDRFRRVVQKWTSQRASADEVMERVADHASVT